jgi:hypothetical protein
MRRGGAGFPLDLSRWLRESDRPVRRPLLVLVIMLGGRSAQAAPAAAPAQKLMATGAAIVPGILVHGSGHFVAGDRRTGWRLLAMEGVGLGLTAAGTAALFVTGASRQLPPPVFALPVAGVGLLAISWLADLYGVAAPAEGTGVPLLEEPALEARVGTRYVYDPTLAYGTLVGPALDLRWRRLRLSPSAWLATGHDNQRLALEAAYRASGPRPGAAAADGSFVDAVAGLAHHRFGPEGFDLTVLEAGARGRVDLWRFAGSLAGSFAEWGLGVGWVLTRYRVGAQETDGAGLLLARFGYGVYLGRAAEAVLFYDHRHDDYAGGLKLTGLGSGVAGHFGLEGSWFFAREWGLRAEAQVGSAYLAGLALVYRREPR